MPTGKARPRHETIGRYEVTEWLGSGASAAVYLGHDPALDAPVAIKVLADHHSSTPEIRERFIREARMLRRISHDRVVTIRDIGEVDGQPYFVMDAFSAGTLADRLQHEESRVDDPDSLLRVVEELAACLAAVHDAGLIHRDIKPSNLLINTHRAAPEVAGNSSGLLAPGEQLVLADFGIAREADLTGLTQGIGTTGFMAPEQAQPLATIDQRVDIYAATAIVRLIATRDDQANQPTAFPTALAAAIDRGLADDPADRPASAQLWQESMHEALAAPRPEVAPSTPEAHQGLAETGRPGTAAPASRPRSVLLVAVLAFLGVVAAMGLWLAQSGGGPQIVGPDHIQVDTSATYAYEPVDGATYVWIDSTGQTFTEQSITVSPRTPGFLSLTLQETLGGSTDSSTLRIEVTE